MSINIMNVVSYLSIHGPEIIAAVNGVILALVALFALVPGNQPEAALHGLADFIAKFSRKNPS